LLLTLTLPRITDYMTTAVIEAIYVNQGESISLGAKLLDLRVDLSAAISHDCPPISFFRLALRDRAWLRRLYVSPGNEIEVGAPLAQFSTEPNEPLDREPGRPARVSIAGILPQSDWWNEARR
jgi:pyruvate/2-oxoglutarate dehydrogenase complex dihydrolipoamide acyltransferase (E2) component